MTRTTRFGTDVVKFREYAPDPTRTPGALGVLPLKSNLIPVPGCRHRPLVAATAGGARAVRAEFSEPGAGVATGYYQSTCPPHPAALAAKASDVIEVNGQPFQIVGRPNVFNDGDKPFKVTIISEQQTVA